MRLLLLPSAPSVDPSSFFREERAGRNACLAGCARPAAVPVLGSRKHVRCSLPRAHGGTPGQHIVPVSTNLAQHPLAVNCQSQ
jgi:hypothetical protein